MQLQLFITRKVLFEKFSINTQIEGFFLSVLDGCEIKTCKNYPDSVFLIKENQLFFGYNSYNRSFNVKNNGIWSILKQKYRMNQHQIQTFIKNMFDTHVKIKEIKLTNIKCFDEISELLEGDLKTV